MVSLKAPRLLTEEEVLVWMLDQQWIYAKTMPRHPHEYSLKRFQDPRRFEDVVLTIWKRGYDRTYLNRLWRSIDVGNRHYIWVHTKPKPDAPAPREQTILINRVVYPQDRLDL